MLQDSVRCGSLFDLDQSLAGSLLAELDWPWQALTMIHDLILRLGPDLPVSEYEQLDTNIWVARDCHIAASASLSGPLIIGHETEIRHGAFIRSNALIGNQVVVGNSTEIKNVILFNGVQAPHFNYVGDSILGVQAHMGAGAITSNVKGDHSLIRVQIGAEKIPTGLKKLGAMMGDFAEIGCNSVLNPGSIICRNTQIYPMTMVRGTIPPNCILKQNGDLVARQTRT
ncbi:MAG: UDP-N-acetylglucosamine pyrophosphorylase [Ruminococcaceae bacterium]|nr:UDP-N-acetylglucosamine pyrophosphorylase [Oscillospiraceae bacterium]